MKRVVLKNTALVILVAPVLFASACVFAETTENASMTFTVNVPVFLTATVNNVTMNASTNNFVSEIMDFTASTNNQTGYTSTMTTNKNSTESYATDLKHASANVVVPSLTSAVSRSNFPINHWGFSLDNITYSGLPAKNQTPISVSSSLAPASDEKDIYFGAKVDGTKASGIYTNEVLITTVANYVPEMRTLADITYMQEVTNDICGNTPTPLASDGASTPQYQLIDNRDNKTYWVAKLADGKCWMTQNLDLNLNSSVALTDEKTDLNSVTSWTPTRSTIDVISNMTTTGTSATITGWEDDYNTPYSVDPGNVYFDGTYYSSSTCNYLTTNCEHFKNTKQTLNNEHGHVGNYYNWSATVASNNTVGFATQNADYPDSICPKGWRLPHGHNSSSGDDFQTLNTAYGGSINSDQTLLSAPLFFARTGGVWSGALNYAAYNGGYWSSTISSPSIARDFDFDSSGVSPFNVGSRDYGFSARCVAGEANTYTIDYDKNTTAAVSNLPENVTSKTHSNSVPISSNTPTRSGYQFAGWATTSGGTATYQPGALVDVSSGSVTLYAVWQEAHVFTLNYNANGGTGAPAAQTETTTNTSATFTISSTIPTKENYDFAGWATTNSATTPIYVYNANSFTPASITVTSNITLYAVWNENAGIAAISYMQEMTPAICAETPTPQASDGTNTPQYQLTDNRDGKKYWVAKLADGKCWMTQNLDLDLDVNTKLTPENTDLNSTEVVANSGWTPTRSTIDITSNMTTTGTSATITGWADDNNTPYSIDPGNVYFDGTYFESSLCNYLTTNCEYFKNTKQTLNNEHGHIGNYYNWSAVVASNNTASFTTINADYPDSICPKGWRLPYGDGSSSGNDFEALNNAYGGTTNSDQTLLFTPLFFVRAGRVWSSGLGLAAHYGFYWSSTVGSSYFAARNLNFYSSNVYLSGSYAHFYGFSVRCVVRTESLLGAANGYTDPQGKIEYYEEDNTSRLIVSILLGITATTSGMLSYVCLHKNKKENSEE